MNRPQWEAYAPQSDEVIQVIDRLKHICGGAEVEHGWAIKQKKKQEAEKAAEDNYLSKGVVGLYRRLKTTVDEDEEADDDLGLEAKRELYRLREYQARCEAVAGDISCIASLLRDIGAYQTLASDKTSSLHQTCNKLLEEQEELQQRASKLREPLSYFNKLDELGRLLGMPMIGSSMNNNAYQPGKFMQEAVRPGSDAFLEALAFIEVSINHFEGHPEYKDGALYLEKFEQLKLRALTLIKDQVTGHLEKAGKAVSAEEGSSGGRKSHLFEASLIYTKFRAVSHKVSESMKLLQDSRFPQIFTECQERYFEIRLSLLRPAVRSYLNDVLSHNDLVSMVRFGTVYFTRLCQLEIALYSSCGMDLNECANDLTGEINVEGGGTLLPKTPAARGLLMDNLKKLCEELYCALRPRMLREDTIDKLSEFISVTQEELLQENQRHKQQSRALALEIALNRLIRDTQERVILLAHKTISTEIRNFKPDIKDLDYPAILTSSQQTTEGDVDNSSNTAGDDTQLLSDAYKTWYPPLNSTLTLLSKLYGVVNVTVFEEVACSTVAACTASLVAAAPNIPPPTNSNTSERLPSDGPASFLHRQLFLIKHLITLQEQLVPFNIHYLYNDRRLSFDTTRSAIRRLLGGRLNNVRQGLPLVYEVETDVRRDMEVALRESCDRFVAGTVEVATKPISSFLVKAKAFRDLVVSPKGDGNDENLSQQSSPLLQQSFAQPARVMETLREAYQTISSNLTLSKQILSLWLRNNATESTLLNSVRRRISDIVREIRVMLGDCYPVQDVTEFAVLLERMMTVVDEPACSLHQQLSVSNNDPDLWVASSL